MNPTVPASPIGRTARPYLSSLMVFFLQLQKSLGYTEEVMRTVIEQKEFWKNKYAQLLKRRFNADGSCIDQLTDETSKLFL